MNETIQKAAPRKPPVSEGKTANAHRSPSLVMPALRTQIVASVRAGRPVVQVAKEFNVTQACVLELMVRAMNRDFDFRLERLEDEVLPPRPSMVRVA